MYRSIKSRIIQVINVASVTWPWGTSKLVGVLRKPIIGVFVGFDAEACV